MRSPFVAGRIPPVCFALAALAGCGGGVPLMHTAHPVAKGDVTFGAGFSGVTAPVTASREGTPADGELVEAASVAPGLAPWIGGRLGFGAGLDAGLTYSGRAARLDLRRAFPLTGSVDLSVGAGASALLPHRRERLGLRVGGFGADVPVLVGWRSTGEIYAAWFGLRGGAELLRGRRELASDPLSPEILVNEPVGGRHGWAGGLVGMRVGFRHVFAVLEVDAAMHWVTADVAGRAVSSSQLAVAPAAALVSRF
ncbi:MAG: hypothetical protein FJ096_09360 [Deltaproteobacteria bacterium]|nr:hypothetical protein [Deltaproteobacteria bacterium]